MAEKFNVEKNPKTFAYVLERDTGNIRCNRCDSVVLRSDVQEQGYKYQCMSCDEDLFGIETHEGDFHSDEELNELLLDTQYTLLLDD